MSDNLVVVIAPPILISTVSIVIIAILVYILVKKLHMLRIKIDGTVVTSSATNPMSDPTVVDISTVKRGASSSMSPSRQRQIGSSPTIVVIPSATHDVAIQAIGGSSGVRGVSTSISLPRIPSQSTTSEDRGYPAASYITPAKKSTTSGGAYGEYSAAQPIAQQQHTFPFSRTLTDVVGNSQHEYWLVSPAELVSLHDSGSRQRPSVTTFSAPYE
eukprot:PhF_6_TR481/c0_g1_i2/m.223